MKGKLTSKGEITDEELLARLAKIEGQIRGIARMVAEGRYCIDVINQITAARAALAKTAMLVMHRHLNNCVKKAMAEGRGAEITDELVETLARFVR